MPSFSNDEYRQRIKRTKSLMDSRGVDVLLLTSPENLNYLTGYDGMTFYIHQMGALARDADEPLLILRSIDVDCASQTAFISEDSVVPYPEDYIGRHDRHVMEFVSQVVRDRGWADARLGVELDAPFFTARCYDELKSHLPRAQFVDADRLVKTARLVKSPAELEYMRQAGRLAALAMQTAIDSIEPGVRECDVAAKVIAAQIAGDPGFGGDIAIAPLISVGEKTRAPHLSWSDAPISDDAAINIILNGARHHYHAPLARTLYLGTPPSGLVELAEAAREGLEGAVRAMRPGAICHDVQSLSRELVQRRGFDKKSRFGYSVGLCYAPTWIEGTASLIPGDMTVLEPNMTFEVVLGMWNADHNVVLGETIRVTENAAERLSEIPRKLVVKG